MEEKLFYNDREYTLGATVGPKTGTGAVSYTLSGLCADKDYNVILVAYKNEGTVSNIVGPHLIQKII